MPYLDWDGQRLHYRAQGKGRLLLLLPGNTASSACHEGELAYFSDRYRVVALDFLGTGRSDRVVEWADDWWEEGARQAAALVTHLGYADCVAMGTSGGALAALLMAIQHPAQVRAVIADSCVERSPPEFLERTVVADRARCTPDQISFWSSAHGADWEQVVDADTQMIARFARGGGDWFEGRLSQIRCPALLTASRQDELLHDVSRQLCRMAEQIPDCRIFLDAEGGHPLMWSRPQSFRAISDPFLEGLEG